VALPPDEEIVIEEEEEDVLPDVEVDEEEEEIAEAAEEPSLEPAAEELVADEPTAEEPTPLPHQPEDIPLVAMEAPAEPAFVPSTASMEAAVGPGSSNFAGRAKIEHLLMEGEVRMTVSDYANAVKVYQKLVEAAPKVAVFRMRLAIAMTCYPRTAKLAEREFVEAVRLDPRNADFHYQFGLYFKAMKVRSRAIAEMRTAVSLDPRHDAAREELEALSPKDSVLGSLRKMFR
jgi:tetratricopeptide (TPR) repeat protein